VSDEPIIDVRNLDVAYGASQVLFGLSLRVERNQAVAILGRNGAGKTTLLKTIIGELAAQGGEIRYDGANITKMPTEARFHRGLGYVPQEQAVFGTLTVRENLQVGAMYGTDRSALEYVLEMFPKLRARLGQSAGTLSGGERKMLGISRALLGRPKVLMLDEPTEGVWIGVIDEIAERLRLLARDMSIVIVEQHLELALGIANQAYVLERGKVALQGSAEQVRSDPKLLEYLAP
jgi:branched-chain amino acid transport system ATP-binding protein